MSPENHKHTHSHTLTDFKYLNKAFFIGIALNALYTGIEFIAGYYYDSLALISDATHNLSDVASLILSLIGLKLTQKAATTSYTYGYKKASILASLVNAVLLMLIVIVIIKEAIERLYSLQDVVGESIIIVAGIGVIINALSAILFYKGQKDDINVRGAFLHLIVDALISFGVVISGIIIYYTNLNIIDSIVSIIIAIIIIITTWGLLKESLRLSIDAVPKDIDSIKIKQLILENEFVNDVHHIHIWAISSKSNALTAHIKISEDRMSNMNSIKEEIKLKLLHYNIDHSTIEIELENEICEEKDC